ncbi:hypothetical protein [Modestobacter sp. VKM Ac-2985]|uniref:hypothetical protein n=1 Tax=Modestobacter sp. VKM Ac-2985 TaxID=3004139 RepID=UPI0022AB5897|nr:hypothetical protein [Modestobacter sp. VKM Ac-2985]MCZ2839764.1 hypothetical protein [Modestobacter sp. VKM Ac-2985]
MAPKSWAIAHPETAAKLVSPPGRGYIAIVRPVLLGINALANELVAASGVTAVDVGATIGDVQDASLRSGHLRMPSSPPTGTWSAS